MNEIKKKDRMKTVFTIITFLLLYLLIAVSGCAMHKSESAGRINGVYIDKQDFVNSLRGHFTGFVLEKDRNPDEAEKNELYIKTWHDITIHVILTEYFKKYKINVTEKEVIDTLISNIPSSIMKAPIYQKDGQFNRSAYIAALISGKTKELDWLKRYYYEYYVPLAKLKAELQNSDLISRKELDNLYKVLNTQADIAWIVFDPSRAEVKVSQSEIESYYHRHLTDYKVKRYAEFVWTELPVNLSQDDVNAAKIRIDSIYYEISNGKPFTMMAELYSQTASADQGGALGFVKFADLSSDLKAMLDPLERGGFTRPLRISDYWVIYQLVERTQNLVSLNEIAIKITPGADSKNRVKETAIHLRDLALQLGMETAAEEMRLTSNASGVVDKDSLWMSDSEVCAYLIDRAYTQQPGAVLEPVFSNVLQAWIVAEVKTVQPHEIKTLISVSDEIDSLLTWEKQLAVTEDMAEKWATQHKSSLLKSASEQGLEIASTKNLGINGYVKSAPVKKLFVDVINAHNRRKAQVPYQAGNYIVLPVISRTDEVNPPQITSEDVRDYYFNVLNPNWFDTWLNQQVRKASVKIWYAPSQAATIN
jgi:hypothetical protein